MQAIDEFEFEDDQLSDEQVLINAIEAAEFMGPRRWLAQHGGWVTTLMGQCRNNAKSRYNALVKATAKATKPVPGPEAIHCPGSFWA